MNNSYDITFCLMTCGEETESECLKAIEPFREKIVFQEVRNVFPQIKALNQMLDQTDTEFLVPLDSDMILNADAYNRITKVIDENTRDNKWHSILFPLYDTLTETNILALKVLRMEIMKKFPFKETATPDVEHFQCLTDAGYTCLDGFVVRHPITNVWPVPPIGNHVVKGKHFCYHKYRDVYMTFRSHGWEWDQNTFMGGETLKEKSKQHFNFFIKKYLMTDDEDCLWCIAGMVDGLTSEVDHKSKNLKDKDYKVDKKSAVEQYFNWYRKDTEKFVDGGDYLF